MAKTHKKPEELPSQLKKYCNESLESYYSVAKKAVEMHHINISLRNPKTMEDKGKYILAVVEFCNASYGYDPMEYVKAYLQSDPKYKQAQKIMEKLSHLSIDDLKAKPMSILEQLTQSASFPLGPPANRILAQTPPKCKPEAHTSLPEELREQADNVK